MNKLLLCACMEYISSPEQSIVEKKMLCAKISDGQGLVKKNAERLDAEEVHLSLGAGVGSIQTSRVYL